MRVFALGLGILCLWFAVSQAPKEFATFVRHRAEGLDHFTGTAIESPEDLSAELGRPPGSIEGKYLALRTCRDALQTRLAERLMRNAYLSVADACLTLTGDILGESPSFALAHLVRALALKARGAARTEIGDAVRASHAAAPGLSWMAADRLLLMLPDLPGAAGDLKTRLDGDIALLAQSLAGQPLLARLYVEHEDLRPIFTDVIETLPADAQRRFVRAVRDDAG